MNTAVARIQPQTADAEHALAVHTALKTSLYPGASDASIHMVLAYCKAAGLDPMQKPVHIVPMWDSKTSSMRDVVMPGVGMYRTQASRTGQFAGMTEAEFGPDITRKIGDVEVTYPEWARVTVKRALANGMVAEFTAREFWIENYATKGGKERSLAPNAMWAKRPRGQIAKCAAAQALRIAFPELGAAPTADEMEGKTIDSTFAEVPTTTAVKMPQARTAAPTAHAEPQSDGEQPHAQEAPTAAPRGEPGIFVSDSQLRILLKKGELAGLNMDELLAKYTRIDGANINDVLADLRALSEAQS